MTGRPLLLISALGLAALGATCKGSEPKGPSNSAEKPKKEIKEEPLVKAPAVTDIEGLDLGKVPPASRGDAIRLLNETYCYCGCARTVAACLANREACSCVRCSERMANFVLEQYAAGASTGDVEDQLVQGFAAGYNAPAKPFEVKDQPMKGAAGAPVTLVEFADFRCGHCAAASEVLSRLLATRSDTRLAYFYFPLGGGGETSIRAAEAAEEARAQGKFWELSQVMFRNQHALEPNDLSRYASQVGLDVPRFNKALAARTHREAVMADKRLGESLGIQSTPSIYVNGRPFGFGRSLENFNLRIDMELERGRCD